MWGIQEYLLHRTVLGLNNDIHTLFRLDPGSCYLTIDEKESLQACLWAVGVTLPLQSSRGGCWGGGGGGGSTGCGQGGDKLQGGREGPWV